MSIRHRFTSPIADAGDPNEVGPNEWNDTHAEVCGSVTLSTGAATVVFATPEANTSYYVSLAGNADEVFRWANKTVNGFDIVSSNGASTATVDWKIARA